MVPDGATGGDGRVRRYDASILLECDNARRKGRHRAAMALEALAAELVDPPGSIEVLVGVPGQVVPGWLAQLARSSGLLDRVGDSHLRTVPVGDAGYHGTKHQLAAAASGDVFVFVDIDVIVEPGWLASLLAPFDDPQVAATFGFTRIGPVRSAYDRAMSATWVFDPRRPEEGGAEHPFRSNNVAFRAGTYDEHPFRPYAGEYRGAGTRLWRELEDAGLRMERVSATTLHPPLAFPVDFVTWPLLTGRDRATRPSGSAGRRPGHTPPRVSRRTANLRARARAAEVRPHEVPLVLAIAGSIRMLQAIGMLIGRVRPRLLDRWA